MKLLIVLQHWYLFYFEDVQNSKLHLYFFIKHGSFADETWIVIVVTDFTFHINAKTATKNILHSVLIICFDVHS
jgi:hypothetical protein